MFVHERIADWIYECAWHGHPLADVVDFIEWFILLKVVVIFFTQTIVHMKIKWVKMK